MNHGIKDFFEAEKEVKGLLTARLPPPRHFCLLSASFADKSVHGSWTTFLGRCPSGTCVRVQGSPTQSHHDFFGDLALTGLTAGRFTGVTGWFFDN